MRRTNNLGGFEGGDDQRVQPIVVRGLCETYSNPLQAIDVSRYRNTRTLQGNS